MRVRLQLGSDGLQRRADIHRSRPCAGLQPWVTYNTLRHLDAQEHAAWVTFS